ncbi:MAG: sulfatase [Planctomycetaceae bacterium]
MQPSISSLFAFLAAPAWPRLQAGLLIGLGILCLVPERAGCAGQRRPNPKPNVLFLICDDLNCNLGCYGHPIVRSPHIDRLAARGVRFESAFCQYPLCGPSRASLMTGLAPDQTLVRKNGVAIRDHVPNVQTLAQMFRHHGYQATRIGKIFHYGVPSQIGTSGVDDPDSWDDTINPRGRDKDDEPLIFSVKRGEYGGYVSWLAADGVDAEQTDGIAATAAARLIKEYTQQDRQFFLAVGLYRPHTPYIAPQRYFAMYPPDANTVPVIPEGYLETLPQPARKSLTRKPEHYRMAEGLARHAMQAYYASITFADAQVGRVLDALDDSGAADNTIVVFTSDHGYHPGEHGHWLKTTLFEDAARVPLIFAGPGVPAVGESTLSIAELVDLYPTLAELCGLTAPPGLAGVSLAPTLKDVSVAPRTSALTQLQDNNYTIRTVDSRYTEWGENGGEGVEFYDRTSDPAEMVNLAADPRHAETIARLSLLLRARIESARKAPIGVTQIRVSGEQSAAGQTDR